MQDVRIVMISALISSSLGVDQLHKKTICWFHDVFTLEHARAVPKMK